jgi:hypothetical protein
VASHSDTWDVTIWQCIVTKGLVTRKALLMAPALLLTLQHAIWYGREADSWDPWDPGSHTDQITSSNQWRIRYHVIPGLGVWVEVISQHLELSYLWTWAERQNQSSEQTNTLSYYRHRFIMPTFSEYLTSKQGAQQLLHSDGYIFSRERNKDTALSFAWRCCHFSSPTLFE